MKKVNNMTVFEPTDKCSLDEYSEKAATEVPELIKKAKEEVNKKITEISENDIKQDNEILELKTNYTNLQEQNTKLESQIKKDRENMINLEVEGQSIHIEDSSDLEGQLEVLGNVEQDVREGYNLLNNSLTNRTVNGLTVIVNKDKSVTIKGTPTANATIKIDDTKNKNLPAGTYTLKDCQAYIESEENNGWWNGTRMASTLIFKNTPTLANHGFYLYFSSGIAVNKTYYPQLVAGPEEKPYEPYGASPSPEYPSEIRTVGDNVNLLNWGENITKNIAWKDTGESYTSENTNGTPNFIKIINTITISYNGKVAPGNLGRFNTYDKDKKIVATELITKLPYTKKFNSNEKYYTFHLVSPYVTYGSELKLELGEVPTSYSKFGQGSVEIKKTSANYYNVKTYSGSQQPPVDENDWITLTGNNTGTSPKYLNYFTRNLDVIVGEKYWIVAEIKNVLGKGTFNITSQFFNQGQFNQGQFKGYLKQIQDIKAGDVFIYQSTAVKTKGDEQGLRTFIELRPDESANITFRLSVLEENPNNTNWKYVPYKKETKILPIQKPMLEGDYFIKEADGWKEVHKLEKKIFNGTERFGNIENTGSVKYFSCYEVLNTYKYLGDNTANYISNCFKSIPVSQRYQNNTFFINSGKNPIFSSNSFSTTEEFKAKLVELYNANNPMYIYYELATPTKLPCTPEQTKILDELDNFQTYKPVTNITTDSIAKLKLKYIADTKTYVDNKISNLEQQVSVINQLLSTTKTSSVLLDNLQFDIESEVL